MANTDLRDEWQAAQNRLDVVIAEAGLQGALKKEAKDPGDIAAERSLVFALPLEAQRKRIIYWSRECHRLRRATGQQEWEDLQREVRQDGSKIRRTALWGVLIFGAVVTIGTAWLAGAVAATVAGIVCLLLGIVQIRRANRRAVLSVDEAKRRLTEQEAVMREFGNDDGGIYTAMRPTQAVPMFLDAGRSHPARQALRGWKLLKTCCSDFISGRT